MSSEGTPREHWGRTGSWEENQGLPVYSVSSATKKEGEVRVAERLLCARRDAHPPSTVSCFLLLSALWGKHFCSTSEETSARRGGVTGRSHGLVSSRLSRSSGPAEETAWALLLLLNLTLRQGRG